MTAVVMEPYTLIGTLVRIGTLAIGLTFAYAAVSKIASFPDLLGGIRAYTWIPRAIVPALGIALVLAETTVAITHFSLIEINLAAIATISLLFLFLIFQSIVLARGEKRPCMCFGVDSENVIDGMTLTRPGLLIGLESILIFALETERYDIWPIMEDIRDFLWSTVAAGTIVFLTGWCMAAPKLLRAIKIMNS